MGTPMRTTSTLLGLTLVALAATARAQESAPAAAAAPPPAYKRRIQVGLTLLPMGLGQFSASPGGVTMTADAAFAFGVGVSASYVIRPGLSVGLAPQAIFNVKPKVEVGDAAKQYDLMARVAYTFPVVDNIALYAEVLPGYSIISPPDGDSAKGLVLAFGGGAAMDLTDKTFATLGVGYQIGFQKRAEMNTEVSTKYVRVAVGGGVRF
jgi:Outer membrane protein beta-barrel domain